MVFYDVIQVIDTLASNNLELCLDVLNGDISTLVDLNSELPANVDFTYAGSIARTSINYEVLYKDQKREKEIAKITMLKKHIHELESTIRCITNIITLNLIFHKIQNASWAWDSITSLVHQLYLLSLSSFLGRKEENRAHFVRLFLGPFWPVVSSLLHNILPLRQN